MKSCEDAVIKHGFRRVEISATLVGEPLYKTFGYSTQEYYEIPLKECEPLKVARMTKTYHSLEQGAGTEIQDQKN